MGYTDKVLAIDFFCGAGGMTNGLIQAGIHVLAGIDNNSLCEKTYLQNVNPDGTNPNFICKDIFPTSDEYPGGEQHEIAKLLTQLIKKQTSQSGKRPKLIFALCAPCQPFTKISRIKMSESRKFKRTNDSNLLLTTVHLIKKFNPDALICENVEGITGEGSVLSQFEAQLNEIGYVFNAKVINAAKFGVPQNRRRTIGLAVRIGKRKKFEIFVPDADPDLKKYVTVAEVIGHLPPLAAGEAHPTIKNHRARSLSDINLKRIASAPPGESNSYLKNTRYGDLSLNCHKRLETKAGKASFTDTYTRMHGDDVGPTITTRCVSVSNGRFAHYDTKQNRGITAKEAALLQTFPDEYVFYPEDSGEFAAVLIGNAVPPRLAKFFGGYIRKQLTLLSA